MPIFNHWIDRQLEKWWVWVLLYFAMLPFMGLTMKWFAENFGNKS